jgi:ribose 5-phosphate isomerase A
VDTTALKREAGQRACDFVEDGMTLGLGTGSTVRWTIERLGEMVRGGLRVRGVATSRRTEGQARALGIPLVELDDAGELDLAIDGADEIGPDLALIKGGGGALLREKLVASAARRFVVVADASKRVATLGRFPLPVEVVPFGWQTTARRIASTGCRPTLRRSGAEPYTTDNGNYLLDCAYGAIEDPGPLAVRLKLLPGVVEHGLFVGMAELALLGRPEGVALLRRTTA